jgi:tetratricopeptide (TPR) repeat protein
LALVQEHLDLQREIGDQDGIAEALADLGHLAFYQGEHQKAIALFEESLLGFRTVGNRWAISFWLSVYGFDLMYWLGDSKRAAEIYEEAFAFAQEVADRFLVAISGVGSGIVAWLQGKHARATQLTRDSLAIFRIINHQPFVASSLHMLGGIALAQGNEEEAMQWYESEITHAREYHFESITILTLASLGRVAWAKGNLDLAQERFEEGLRAGVAAGLRPAIFHNLCGLGRVAYSQGDYAAARTHFTQALEIEEWQIDAPLEWAWMKTYAAAVADALSGLAAVAHAQNQVERAASLLGTAETLFPSLYCTMSAMERTVHENTDTAIRAALGEEAFAAVYERAKMMTRAEAVADAKAGI